jgi:transcription-repair coupling factor (superfamily II helicase)
LAQAVNELKKREKPLLHLPFVSIDLPLDAYLPEDYVPSPELRLRLYRRFAGLTSIEEINEMEDEIEDRFGALPQPVRNLLYQLRLKVLAIEAGVKAISAEEWGILIVLSDKVDRRRLERLLGDGAKVGKDRIWLPLSEIWRDELMRILSSLLLFK